MLPCLLFDCVDMNQTVLHSRTQITQITQIKGCAVISYY